MQIVTDYKELTLTETIERLKKMVRTQQPYRYNDETIYNAIKALEQEPKTGHWIVQPSNKEQGERDFIWWKCSECGQVIFSETEHDRLEFHAFCGRCGAKMVEPQESEE